MAAYSEIKEYLSTLVATDEQLDNALKEAVKTYKLDSVQELLDRFSMEGECFRGLEAESKETKLEEVFKGPPDQEAKERSQEADESKAQEESAENTRTVIQNFLDTYKKAEDLANRIYSDEPMQRSFQDGVNRYNISYLKCAAAYKPAGYRIAWKLIQNKHNQDPIPIKLSIKYATGLRAGSKTSQLAQLISGAAECYLDEGKTGDIKVSADRDFNNSYNEISRLLGTPEGLRAIIKWYAVSGIKAKESVTATDENKLKAADLTTWLKGKCVPNTDLNDAIKASLQESINKLEVPSDKFDDALNDAAKDIQYSGKAGLSQLAKYVKEGDPELDSFNFSQRSKYSLSHNNSPGLAACTNAAKEAVDAEIKAETDEGKPPADSLGEQKNVIERAMEAMAKLYYRGPLEQPSGWTWTSQKGARAMALEQAADQLREAFKGEQYTRVRELIEGQTNQMKITYGCEDPKPAVSGEENKEIEMKDMRHHSQEPAEGRPLSAQMPTNTTQRLSINLSLAANSGDPAPAPVSNTDQLGSSPHLSPQGNGQ